MPDGRMEIPVSSRCGLDGSFHMDACASCYPVRVVLGKIAAMAIAPIVYLYSLCAFLVVQFPRRDLRLFHLRVFVCYNSRLWLGGIELG